MEIQYNSLEEKLVFEGKLTQYQILEIRRIFSLFDIDKSGSISYQELASAMQNLSKNSFTQEDYQKIIEKIDLNKDGIIEWNEFLKCISEWLEIFENSENQANNQISPIKRQKFHDQIKKFFFQFKNELLDQSQIINNYENIEDLENRSDEWDYNGERNIINSNKWLLLESAIQNLVDKFKVITQTLESNDQNTILIGLNLVFDLMRIGNLFITQNERFQISHYLIKLFDFLDSSTIIKVLKLLKENRNNFIISFECIKIITLFAPGPRITNLSQNSIFHPNKMLHKNFLIQNEILDYLFETISNPVISPQIRDQSMLAIGFLAKNSPQIRDFILLQNGFNVIYNTYSSDRTIKEMEKISWVLSILAGVSMKIPLRDNDKLIILNTIFRELLFWRDNTEILTNSLLGLSYTFPALLQDDNNNEKAWNRVLALLTHPSIMVKRASLICLGRMILDDTQCQILIEFKLVEYISDLLNYNNYEIKLSVIKILKILLEKGYGIWVMSNASLLKNLFNCLYQNALIRNEIIKLIKIAASQQIIELNKCLLNFNLIKGLIDNLQEFKEFDYIFAEIYGFMEPSYDFKILINSFKILNFIINENLIEISLLNNEYCSNIFKEFNQNNINKIQKVIDTLFIDIQNKQIDYFILLQNREELAKSLFDFLSNLKIFYQKYGNQQYSIGIINCLTSMIENFKINFTKLEGLLQSFSSYSSTKIELVIAEIEELSKVKSLIIEKEKSLVEILLILENLFQISPINIFYYDEENRQKYIINDNATWNKVLIKAGKSNIMKDPNYLTIKILISSPLKKGACAYLRSEEPNSQIFNYEMTNIFGSDVHTNLEKYETLLQDLKGKTKLSTDDINALYTSFTDVTNMRKIGKYDGSVNFEEFLQIVRSYIKDQNFAKEIFALLSKNNYIDFRDFVRLISVLKSDNLEEKLKLYFKTYDIDNNGFLDKREIFEMLKNSVATSGYLINSTELKEKVDKIFEISDINKDGKLSFTEFKEAVAKNFIFVNSLWLDPNQIKLNQMFNFYFLRNNNNFNNQNANNPNKNFENNPNNHFANKYNFQKYKLF